MGFDYLPPYFYLGKDVFHEGIDHSLDDFSRPTFIFEEEGAINDNPSLEIFVETLFLNMMFM